jgi:uncharacterized membrane protein
MDLSLKFCLHFTLTFCRLLLACLIVSFVLSMWIANIGVVVMLMPIIFAIKKELLATELVSETTIEDNTPPSENLPSKGKMML